MKLRGIFNIKYMVYLQRVGMIAMFCSENIVKVFSVQYTYYTFNSKLIHTFVYLHSKLAYQTGNKSKLRLQSTIKILSINYANPVTLLRHKIDF